MTAMAGKSTAIDVPIVRPGVVSAIAACCLAAGILIGYLARGAELAQSTPQKTSRSTAALSVSIPALANGHVPTLGEMKQMADKQAAPLLEKLKSHPDDAALLAQIGATYHTTHQFQEASAYYGRAVQLEPKDVALRTKLASSLYRGGDADGAIAQLNQALSYAPSDANTLFNLGMIKLQGKGDAKGAVTAWEKLLKTNPQLSPERKAEVQKLMSEATMMIGNQGGSKTAGAHVHP